MATTQASDLMKVASPPGPPRREVIGGWLLLLGYGVVVLGFVWDQQWHFDVGPDTFFTAPHTLLYSGTALIGLTSLAVVLANTYVEPETATGPSVTVFRTFRAPPAFLVGGLAAAAFLFYGMTDLWWHTIYGFDLQGASWSHNGLVLAMGVAAVATVMAFARLRGGRSERWGFAAACAISAAGSTITAAITFDLADEVFFLCMAGLCALVLGVAARVTGSPRWMLLTGLLFFGFQALAFLFSPFATRFYADALEQPMRDNALGLPMLAVLFPGSFPIVAAIAAGVVWFAKSRNVRPRNAIALLGALAGAGGFLWYAAPPMLDHWGTTQTVVLFAATGFGVLMGGFGWHCGALLRGLDPKAAT